MTDTTTGTLDDSLLQAVAMTPDATPPLARWVGEVIADRFVIERLAGSGGMGTTTVSCTT
jgi:hypothetical protein